MGTDSWGEGKGKIGAWIGDKVWKNAEQDGTGGGQAAEVGAAELAILEVGRPAARCDGAAATRQPGGTVGPSGARSFCGVDGAGGRQGG
jgi:hypothetical protein